MTTCRNCGFDAEITQWKPAVSVYADITCPNCGSTNNQHNQDFQNKLFGDASERLPKQQEFLKNAATNT